MHLVAAILRGSCTPPPSPHTHGVYNGHLFISFPCHCNIYVSGLLILNLIIASCVGSWLMKTFAGKYPNRNWDLPSLSADATLSSEYRSGLRTLAVLIDRGSLRQSTLKRVSESLQGFLRKSAFSELPHGNESETSSASTQQKAFNRFMLLPFSHSGKYQLPRTAE